MKIKNSVIVLCLSILASSAQADSVKNLWSQPTDGSGGNAQSFVIMNASPTKTFRIASKTATQLLLTAQENNASVAFYAPLGGGLGVDGVVDLVTLDNAGTVPILAVNYIQTNLDFTGYLSSGQRDYAYISVNGGSNGGFWTEVPGIVHMGAVSALQDRTIRYAPGCIYLYNADTMLLENVCNTAAWAELL